LLSTTTGYQLRSFGESAARLGLELALATDRCQQLDDPWQDGAIAVRFHEEEASLAAVLDAARERPIDGVLAVGDRPAVLAARVADALRLRGNPPAAADATRNKKLMRQRFATASLAVPWFLEVPASADIHALAARVRYPCVVKPLGLSGSRGVIRADNPAQFEYAFERLRALLARPDVRALRTGLETTVLVEQFIEGKEYAIEGVLTRGQLRVLAIFDKPDPLDGPFFEETIYVTPPVLTEQAHHAIVQTLQRATAALGLVHGPIHAECRVNHTGVVVLEIAARPIGGLCARVLRFHSADSHDPLPLEELLLRHAIGEEIWTYRREDQAAGVMMIPIPKRGLLRGVSGEDWAREVPHVDDVRITAKQDQLLEPLPEGDSYLGFIFARAQAPATVVAALREAHKRLAFQIDSEIRVNPR
jgi:biotin carboxylase